MLQIRHQVPGRVRFRIKPQPKQRPSTGRASGAGPIDQARREIERMQDIAAAVARQPGVRSVRLNVNCASLVVRYDPAAITPACLRGAMEPEHEPQQQRPAARRLGKATGSGFWSGPRWRRTTRSRPTASSGPAGMRHRATDKRVERVHRKTPSCPWCVMQRRLSVWLLRSTVRCWWQEWRPGLPVQAARTTADREPLLTRLRERFGGGLKGQALAPEPSA